ncbi:MAG TPA: hypothetical protein DEA96_01805 [Leptospiraceae bacterium]|nr:hypothetical protein [Spirochaetaceae bacterium]HBS03668.1 hypothetical protein [Leptospiraceae bacterium]|tara:strand:+ start:7223 stop:7636 length:414 start_codon:yes stop_codon:yes gene_type:complete
MHICTSVKKESIDFPLKQGWMVTMARKIDPRMEVLKRMDEVFSSPVLGVLAEPVRIELIKQLALLGRSDVKTLAGHLPQHSTVVSRHLKVLYDAGLLVRTKKERWVYYELNGAAFIENFRRMLETVEEVVEVCECEA